MVEKMKISEQRMERKEPNGDAEVKEESAQKKFVQEEFAPEDVAQGEPAQNASSQGGSEQAEFASTLAVAEARAAFPRGLFQPQGSFRFSLDALLLASFAARASWRGRFADLGCGCGVVGLALCLARQELNGIGFDNNAALVDAAQKNAVSLGLAQRFTGAVQDVARMRKNTQCGAETCDAVLCNPPYRLPKQGRLPISDARGTALFELSGTLNAFVKAAAFVLKNKGHFFCIYPADRAADLFVALRGASLEPKNILPVASYSEAGAKLLLVEARKNAAAGNLLWQAPLVLYNDKEQSENSATASRSLTVQALEFCPFLACNAK